VLFHLSGRFRPETGISDQTLGLVSRQSGVGSRQVCVEPEKALDNDFVWVVRISHSDLL
jgi:hypothetical protein